MKGKKEEGKQQNRKDRDSVGSSLLAGHRVIIKKDSKCHSELFTRDLTGAKDLQWL